MATSATLGTAELLASILQELDIKTLLLARRVSRQWFDVIKSSPDLQEKLYYLHRPNKCEDTRYLWTALECHLELCSDVQTDDSTPSRPSRTCLLTSTHINPLLVEEMLPLELDSLDGLAEQGQRIECIAMKDLLKSPHGSWQSMFLSQPPATKVLAQSVIRLRIGADPHHHFFGVEDPAGVKMSQVAEKVLSIAREYGGGFEDLADLRLNNWRLEFPHFVDVAGEL